MSFLDTDSDKIPFTRITIQDLRHKCSWQQAKTREISDR